MPTILPKLVDQIMIIKNQMALWIPFYIKTAIEPKGLSIRHDFCKLDDLCLHGEKRPSTPLTVEYITSIPIELVYLSNFTMES
jgi:hypothetical protein